MSLLFSENRRELIHAGMPVAAHPLTGRFPWPYVKGLEIEAPARVCTSADSF